MIIINFNIKIIIVMEKVSDEEIIEKFFSDYNEIYEKKGLLGKGSFGSVYESYICFN